MSVLPLACGKYTNNFKYCNFFLDMVQTFEQFTNMPASDTIKQKDTPLHNGENPLPDHIVETLIDFTRALRTGHNTTPEDSKIYADLEIEFNNRRVK